MVTKWIAAAGVLLSMCAHTAQAQLPYVVGVWTLNASASKIPEQFPLASETRSYQVRDDGYLVVLAIRTNRNGSPDFIQIAARPDGKDYPQYQSFPLADFTINGTATPLTYSETPVDDHAVEAIGKFNGRVINKGTRRISQDGNTMTLNVTAYGQNGQETAIVLVFDRVTK
jgi:hypothetical protein